MNHMRSGGGRPKKPLTPVRAALLSTSSLHGQVVDALGAVKDGHRDYIDGPLRIDFADSIDVDDALHSGNEQENRWDYLLGHGPSAAVFALEPHSAKTGEISTVIRKKEAATRQLAPHLRSGSRIARWLWVASGPVDFADTEKARRALDQRGILFVGKSVLRKHLP